MVERRRQGGRDDRRFCAPTQRQCLNQFNSAGKSRSIDSAICSPSGQPPPWLRGSLAGFLWVAPTRTKSVFKGALQAHVSFEARLIAMVHCASTHICGLHPLTTSQFL